jgi:hypothetical protein
LHLMALPLNRSLPVNNKVTIRVLNISVISEHLVEHSYKLLLDLWTQALLKTIWSSEIAMWGGSEILSCGSPPPALEACDEFWIHQAPLCPTFKLCPCDATDA